MSPLNITCWNCSGIYGNYVYARKLLKNTDILALSEHWLYEDELSFLDGLDSRFCSYATSSSMNDKLHRWKHGQGGVSLLWKKELKFIYMKRGFDTIIFKYTKNLTAPAGNRTQGLRIYVSVL